MQKKWMLRTTSIDVKKLARECNIDENIAKILVNREINTTEKIKKFLKNDINDLYEPMLMKDMEKGIDIIKNAILNKRKIAIYGDYDADGVTSTVILYKALKYCGANVIYHIPDREAEGYGMNIDRIKKLKDDDVEIILTCDNGISALEQIDYAKGLGMTVVLTDHHELPFEEDEKGNRSYKIPNADAVINPKQGDCKYPFKALCGAGIALKFAHGLYEQFSIDKRMLEEFIEIAGIGTICDVVDLIDENRIIAKNSLKMITNTKNLGLKALKEVLSIHDKEVKSYHIGFQIGPCINATGRLETAGLSVELLLSEDEKKAKELAQTLYELNKKRQDMTNKDVEEIIEIIHSSPIKKDKVLVIYKEDIHESIAGIVAGRVKETFNVPTIVLTKGKEMPKGSARSIDEYNLFEELIKCKELLSKFGGHPMAAGLSLKEENIDKLRKKLNENCKLTDEDIIPKIRIDNRLPLENINYKLIEQIEMLEPFGKGNSTPLLAEKNIPIEKIYILGKNENTLKLRCKIKSRNICIDAICFNRVEEFKEMLRAHYGEEYINILDNSKGLNLDLIFSPNINEYNGNKNIQIKILDFKISN